MRDELINIMKMYLALGDSTNLNWGDLSDKYLDIMNERVGLYTDTEKFWEDEKEDPIKDSIEKEIPGFNFTKE